MRHIHAKRVLHRRVIIGFVETCFTERLLTFLHHVNRISYAHVYNEAFSSKNKTKWLEFALKKSKHFCLRHKRFYIRLVTICVDSQSMFVNTKPTLREKLHKEYVKTRRNTDLVLKKIQEKVLMHLYKPHGIMYRKSLENLDMVHQSHEVTKIC